MIGTFGSSAFRNAEDFKNPQDYLTYLCGDAQGFFTRNVKTKNGYFRETFHKPDALIKRNRYYGVSDCYISQNTVCSPRSEDKPESGRKVNNIKRLNALYVDIDCYKVGMTQDQIVLALEDDYFGKLIPQPTFIINSGRGVYLIWRICEDRNALPRWRSVEDYLVSALTEFGADHQATDAARILRVPFTVNSRNGQMVSIMRFTDVKYTLYEIIKEYGITASARYMAEVKHKYGTATEKQRRTARWIAKALDMPLPDFDDYHDTAAYIEENLPFVTENQNSIKTRNVYNLDTLRSIGTIAAGRIKDLHRLFALRRGEDCCREYALFLCRMWTLDLTNDCAAAITATLALNAAMDCPLDKKTVLKATESAERKWKSGKTYRYSTAKIIAALRITESEQAEMVQLRNMNGGLSEKERKRIANRKAYIERITAAGKETKGIAISKRRNMIALLITQGKSRAEICEMLNISERTFDRDKCAILEEQRISTAKEETAHTAATEDSGAAEICAPKIQLPYYTRNNLVVSACAVSDVHPAFFNSS